MISIVINGDSRPAKTEAGQMSDGIRSEDLLVDSVINKQRFFADFEIETILHLDEHQKVSDETLRSLRELCDCVVIRKHSKHYKGADPFTGFNDINYLHALSLARGSHIAHFDMDMAAFTRGQEQVEKLFHQLTDFSYVCYPSAASPKCVDDPSFGTHIWASTRFFLCEKDTINLTELEQAIWEPQTLYIKYGHPSRICPWTEHHLGVACKSSVYYPPLSKDLLIFPFHTYKEGTMAKLCSMSYDDIYLKLIAAGAHDYHGVDAQRLILE